MEDHIAISDTVGENYYPCRCPKCGGWVEYDELLMQYSCTRCDWQKEEY